MFYCSLPFSSDGGGGSPLPADEFTVRLYWPTYIHLIIFSSPSLFISPFLLLALSQDGCVMSLYQRAAASWLPGNFIYVKYHQLVSALLCFYFLICRSCAKYHHSSFIIFHHYHPSYLKKKHLASAQTDVTNVSELRVEAVATVARFWLLWSEVCQALGAPKMPRGPKL